MPPETRQPVSGYLWGALTGLFVLAVTRLLRAFRGGS
nr:hypothetical protein [Morganella morganii]